MTKLFLYFLKLGATGFGGPVALIGYMHRDLVETRKWFSQTEYNHGLALAQIVPGPLAAQLAIYFGYLRGKIWGATLVGLAFLAAPFVIVLLLSYFYVQFQALPWLPAFSYGMSAAVIGVIVQATLKLVPKTVERRKGLWLIFLLALAYTASKEQAPFWLFLGSGVLGVLWYAWPKGRLFTVPPPALFFFFAKASVVVYGSGMAILPFIYHDLVDGYQWITAQQFLDTVSIGMITPGPLLISAGFVGYLTTGISGAIAAVIGVYLPVYLFVVIFAPWFHKILRNPQIHAFVEGITAAAVGAIAATGLILAQKAIIDWPTAGMAIATLLLVHKTKLPPPLILLAFGGLGVLVFLLHANPV